MKKTVPLAFLLSLAAGMAPFAANAQMETTTEMLTYCDGTSSGGQANADFCTGYISGVLDTARWEGELREDEIFCFPTEGLTVSEAITVVESYARRNPDEYAETFLSTFYFAMLEKYPCY